MLPMLKRGMKGGAVRHLQARLKVAGFDPGRIDGAFGPATEAALMAFQQAEGLLPDGVAGPRSWAALDPEAKALAGDALGLVDVDLAAVMFPSTPLGAIRVHLPHVVAGLREAGLVDGPMALMALATANAPGSHATWLCTTSAPMPRSPYRAGIVLEACSHTSSRADRPAPFTTVTGTSAAPSFPWCA